MAFLDPASNPGSKSQRLGVTNCKSCTSDTFWGKVDDFGIIFDLTSVP